MSTTYMFKLHKITLDCSLIDNCIYKIINHYFKLFINYEALEYTSQQSSTCTKARETCILGHTLYQTNMLSDLPQRTGDMSRSPKHSRRFPHTLAQKTLLYNSNCYVNNYYLVTTMMFLSICYIPPTWCLLISSNLVFAPYYLIKWIDYFISETTFKY